MSVDGEPRTVIRVPPSPAALPTSPAWVPPIDTGQPSAEDLNDLGVLPKATFAAGNTIIPIVYGRDRLFGKVFVAHVDEVAGFLYLAYGFCQGEIQGFETVYIDGVDVNDVTTGFLTHAGAVVELHTGGAGQATSTLLSGALVGYTDTAPDLAYVVIKVPQDSTQGFPRCEAVIQGRKVYDPRGDSTQTGITPVGAGAQRENDVTTWVYSANPTICFRDLVTNFSRWTVLDQGISDLATHNDVLVGSVKRREIGLTLANAQLIDKWVTGFRTYMGAFLGWEDGSVRVIPNRFEVEAQGAAIFDGSAGTWIDMGDQAVLDMGATQDFTLEFKFKTSTSGAIQVLVGKKAQTGTGAGYVAYLDASGGLNVQVQDTGALATATESTGTYDDGEWHTVAMVVDRASDELTLYADGVAGTPVSTAALTLTLANAHVFKLGANGNGIQLFTGSIDEVRVWDDVRTPTEISDNRLAEIENPAVDASLVGYWRLNDGVGATTAVDVSASANDGTLAGSAIFGFGCAQLIPENVAVHITVDDIVKDSLQLTRRSLRSVPNSVAVDYEDSSGTRWFTSRVQSDSARVTSGAEARRLSRVSLPGIHNASQAQREATERLNWYLTDLEARVTLFDDGWCLQSGSIIALTHPIGLDAKLFRVRGLTARSGRWTVDLVEYDPAIYSDTVITNPTTPDTSLGNPLSPPVISGLTLAEELFTYKNGLTGSRVRISYDATPYPFLSQYLVEGYVGGVKVWQTTTQSISIVTPSVEELVSDASVTYEVRVSIQSPFATGAEATDTVSILGKLAVPGNVPSLIVQQVTADEVNLTWEEAIDIDIWRYEVRHGHEAGEVSWETSHTVDLVDGLDHIHPNLPVGTHTFYVKARDSVGNESVTAASATIELLIPESVASLNGFEVASEVRLNWSAVATGFVERYRIAYSDIPETFETTLDIVDTLRFQTKDVPEGTFTFKVYSVDKNGIEAATPATIVIEVTSDADAFLADSYSFSQSTTELHNGTLTNMVEWDVRLDDLKYFVTNMADSFAVTPTDFVAASPLANYHSTGASEWLSETKDFGLPLTGSWNLTHNTIPLLGGFDIALELSTDDATYVAFGGSAKGEFRYARVRINTLAAPGTATVFVKSPLMDLKINVVPLTESGEAVSSTSAPKVINLSREYTAIKEINVQPKNKTAALSGIVDNIIVGSNTGIQCDGTNYLLGGDWTELDFGTGDFSIEYWTKHNGSSSNNQNVMSKKNVANEGFQVFHDYTDKEAEFTIEDTSTNFVSCVTSGDALPDDGNYHHVAITVDRTADQVRIYIDSALNAASPHDISTVTGTISNANNFNVFANSSGTVIHNVNGVLDEVRFWSDVRTPTEIADNYQAELDMTVSHAGLVGYWRMNGAVSTTLSGGTTDDAVVASTNDLTDTGAGALTYLDMPSSNPVTKINSFDAYVFDIFGQQQLESFQWDWKAV